MKDDILFYEIQPFWRNRITTIVFILINLIFAFGFIYQIILGFSFGNNPMSNVGLIIVMACLFLLSVSILFYKLQTVITSEGVYVRFRPFDVKTRFFAWEDIEKAYVRKYSPLREYGGWGIRGGWKSGIAYNISGNIGLQLVFESGRKILIGTNKAEELAEVLKKINGKREQK